ncbi:sugar porter family MFS transporter [Rhodanobacter sp. Col0626]|uniref:sugar porter family MFS transporter n=1 Tax=Rhodanobacter sp. Col0626 TaxID=3415679 RepID=UPI003CF4AB00
MNAIALPGIVSRARAATLLTCALAALAGLMFGLDIGVISGATQLIQAEFAVSDQTIEWIVSAMMLGAAIGAIGAGWLSAALGRKRSLILSALLFVAGSLLCGLAWSPVSLIGARFVLGLAIGMATFTAPLYLAEVAPEQIRGAMISTYQLMITLGIFVAFLSDLALSYSGAWRWMLGIIAIPGALFLLGVLVLPESPRWLMLRGRRDEATAVLSCLRGDDVLVHREVAEIEAQLQSPQHGWQLFRQSRDFRRSVGLGIALQVMQQLTGINVIMYYAPRIFASVGFGTSAQMWTTAIVGLTNMLATFIAIGLVDRLGRKPILYTGFGVMAASLGAVGTMMYLGTTTHAEQIFTVAMLLVFIVGFAMSAGPLVWTLCSEVQPLRGRDFGIACSTFVNWTANMLVGATFLSLLNGIGHAATFWLYGGLNLLFILFTLLWVPETRGVTLEQIERKLMAGHPLREIGR